MIMIYIIYSTTSTASLQLALTSMFVWSS